MSRDIKELHQINEMTKLAQRVVKTFGREYVNGIMSVKTENYKNYQIATKAQEEIYLIKDKNSLDFGQTIRELSMDGMEQVSNIDIFDVSSWLLAQLTLQISKHT
jgi:hypothetical protein